MENKININKLKILKQTIETMDSVHHPKILEILKNNNIHISSNRNGCFINMNHFTDNIHDQLNNFINYINIQEKTLGAVENAKKDIKDVKIAAINISSFSPLIFLFILGNLSFIFNFIFPIKYLIYILIPIIFINLLDLDFKSLTKNKLADLSIKQAEFAIYQIDKIKDSQEEITRRFTAPFFIKPSRGGSSIGVHKVNSFDEIVFHLDELKLIDKTIIIEEEIIGQEIECSIIGNKEPMIAKLGEIINNNGFYDFENKYENNTAEILIPANITQKTSKQVSDIALRTYKEFQIRGLARIDFFYRKKTDEIFLNEINTMPGFTNNSLFPKAWAESGIEINELIKKIIKYAGDNS